MKLVAVKEKFFGMIALLIGAAVLFQQTIDLPLIDSIATNQDVFF